MRYNEACDVLGVSPGATPKEIKRAYRTLARQLHPDNAKSPEHAEQFYRLQAAYDLLSSSDTNIAIGGPQITAPSPYDERPQRTVQWPGARRPTNAQNIGIDVTGSLVLSIEEAHTGTTTEIDFPDDTPCTRCGATGAEPGSIWMRCPDCDGTDRNCRWCQGSGEVPEDTCRACQGAAVTEEKRTLRISVPAGAGEQQIVHVEGRGKWGREQRGDVKLTVRIQDHEFLQRDGNDLYSMTAVDHLIALLGGKATVTGICGETLTIRIKPGTANGALLRIPGRGMNILDSDSDRGDLYAQIEIVVPHPDEIDLDELELYRQIADFRGLNTES